MHCRRHAVPIVSKIVASILLCFDNYMHWNVENLCNLLASLRGNLNLVKFHFVETRMQNFVGDLENESTELRRIV